ncbi:MAG TPA: hypothetical protein VKU94_05590 [Geobacterales bacterium]|nr:hypothetical protein [Geobacterales bacterium]
MQIFLKAAILLILLSAQYNSDYYTLLQNTQDKLAMLTSMLEQLKAYKFDYNELQAVTANASIAVSLINEAQIMHEKGNDSAAINLLLTANQLLDETIKSANDYLAKVQAYNNLLRISFIFATPIAAFITSYFSTVVYNYLNKRRIKIIISSYVRLKKDEDK